MHFLATDACAQAGSGPASPPETIADRCPVSDRPSLTYSSYLALEELLAAQRPRSAEHDELLFIVIHQVYELWFKQMLHEGAHLQQRLEDGDTPGGLHTLQRILTILKTIVAQIDVLETMTPRQFVAFRDRLDAASGFQSAQFRELEALMGRRDPRVLRHYEPDSAEQRRIAAAMARPSLFDSFITYLARRGYDVPADVLERDVTQPVEPSDDVQAVVLAAYRDDGQAAQVCERMVDLDEGLMEWRYRHVQMVHRTIGDKQGTGGSPGARYLATTLLQPAFPDLWAVRTEL
jgi:tryptophan 2,3-dioxygenase